MCVGDFSAHAPTPRSVAAPSHRHLLRPNVLASNGVTFQPGDDVRGRPLAPGGERAEALGLYIVSRRATSVMGGASSSRPVHTGLVGASVSPDV